MMNKKKIIGMFTLVCMVLSLATGCSATPLAVEQPLDKEQQRTQFEQMAQTRVLEEPDGITNENLLETTDDVLISADCPKVSQNEAVSLQLEEYVSEQVSTFKEETASMGTPAEDAELYHFRLTYKPYSVGNQLLGIKFTETAFSGKTDRKNYIETFVYDLKTSQNMGPNEVFDTSQDYLPMLAEVVQDYLLRNATVQESMDEVLFNKGTSPAIQNYSNFVLAPEGRILFYFNPGTIAPAEAGTIEVSVPLEQIDSLLNPKNKSFLYGTAGSTGKDVQAPEDAEDDDATLDMDDGRARLEKLGIEPLPQLYKGDEYMQPQDIGDIDPMEDKVVALTFDDGPSAYTEELLDILKDNDVNATFFMVGQNVERYPDVVKRMYEEGNEIGGHSFDHEKNFTKWTMEEVNEQIESTSNAIQEATGKKPFMDRPPEGAITEEIAEELGREQIMWDVDPEDWVPDNRDPDIVHDHVVNSSQLKDGSVILLHDIRETSVQAVDRIIKDLKEEGYRFVTVSQMIQIAQIREDKVDYVFRASISAEAAKEKESDDGESADDQSTKKKDSGSSSSGSGSSGGTGGSGGSGDSGGDNGGNGGNGGDNGGNGGNGGDVPIEEEPSQGGGSSGE